MIMYMPFMAWKIKLCTMLIKYILLFSNINAIGYTYKKEIKNEK